MGVSRMNKILIVEDEEAISSLIEMSLVRAGYRCETADDGLVAADKIEPKTSTTSSCST